MSSTNVYFFVPNLIGYTRIILALIAVYYVWTEPVVFLVCYAVSVFMDLIDGHAARMFDQSTRYGAVLDMVTDRCSTSMLLYVLGILYPDYKVVFLSLMILDIASHYCHMYSSLVKGRTSHKTLDTSVPWLLRVYYHNKAVLFTLCAAPEMLYLSLYWLYFAEQLSNGFFTVDLATWIVYATLPGCAGKQLMNFIQLVQAMKDIAALDIADRTK
mmetsp:Transcript_34754/g.87394  ORF Transcript_34754/g.87394 Transcript_34754/m.87394 type:complete len:214 (-) Transcript_34754:92-733(-)